MASKDTTAENPADLLAGLSLDEIDETLDTKQAARSGYGKAKDEAIYNVLVKGMTYPEAAKLCIHPTTGKATAANTVKLWVQAYRDQRAKAEGKAAKFAK